MELSMARAVPDCGVIFTPSRTHGAKYALVCDLEKVNQLWASKVPTLYISKGNENGQGKKEKYDFYLSVYNNSTSDATGIREVQLPCCSIDYYEGDLEFSVNDGPHRISVARDMGLNAIPICLSSKKGVRNGREHLEYRAQ